VSCHARFFGKLLSEAKRRSGEFPENPKGATLQDNWDTGLPLSNENNVGFLFHGFVKNKKALRAEYQDIMG